MKTLLLILLLAPMMSFGQRAGNRDAGEIIYLFDLHDKGGEIKVYSSSNAAYGGCESSFTIKTGYEYDNPLNCYVSMDEDITMSITYGDVYYDDNGEEHKKKPEDITTPSVSDGWMIDELVGGYYIVSKEVKILDELEDVLDSFSCSFHIEKSSGDLRKISLTGCLSGTFSDAYVLVTERKRY